MSRALDRVSFTRLAPLSAVRTRAVMRIAPWDYLTYTEICERVAIATGRIAAGRPVVTFGQFTGRINCFSHPSKLLTLLELTRREDGY